MSSITCFGEASGEVQSRHWNGESTGGYWWKVMPIMVEFGELNGNSGRVDADVEVFCRAAALVQDYQSRLEVGTLV